jgi:hypothetical protein
MSWGTGSPSISTQALRHSNAIFSGIHGNSPSREPWGESRIADFPSWGRFGEGEQPPHDNYHQAAALPVGRAALMQNPRRSGSPLRESKLYPDTVWSRQGSTSEHIRYIYDSVGSPFILHKLDLLNNRMEEISVVDGDVPCPRKGFTLCLLPGQEIGEHQLLLFGGTPVTTPGVTPGAPGTTKTAFSSSFPPNIVTDDGGRSPSTFHSKPFSSATFFVLDLPRRHWIALDETLVPPRGGHSSASADSQQYPYPSPQSQPAGMGWNPYAPSNRTGHAATVWKNRYMILHGGKCLPNNEPSFTGDGGSREGWDGHPLSSSSPFLGSRFSRSVPQQQQQQTIGELRRAVAEGQYDVFIFDAVEYRWLPPKQGLPIVSNHAMALFKERFLCVFGGLRLRLDGTTPLVGIATGSQQATTRGGDAGGAGLASDPTTAPTRRAPGLVTQQALMDQPVEAEPCNNLHILDLDEDRWSTDPDSSEALSNQQQQSSALSAANGQSATTLKPSARFDCAIQALDTRLLLWGGVRIDNYGRLAPCYDCWQWDLRSALWSPVESCVPSWEGSGLPVVGLIQEPVEVVPPPLNIGDEANFKGEGMMRAGGGGVGGGALGTVVSPIIRQLTLPQPEHDQYGAQRPRSPRLLSASPQFDAAVSQRQQQQSGLRQPQQQPGLQRMREREKPLSRAPGDRLTKDLTASTLLKRSGSGRGAPSSAVGSASRNSPVPRRGGVTSASPRSITPRKGLMTPLDHLQSTIAATSPKPSSALGTTKIVFTPDLRYLYYLPCSSLEHLARHHSASLAQSQVAKMLTAPEGKRAPAVQYTPSRWTLHFTPPDEEVHRLFSSSPPRRREGPAPTDRTGPSLRRHEIAGWSRATEEIELVASPRRDPSLDRSEALTPTLREEDLRVNGVESTAQRSSAYPQLSFSQGPHSEALSDSGVFLQDTDDFTMATTDPQSPDALKILRHLTRGGDQLDEVRAWTRVSAPSALRPVATSILGGQRGYLDDDGDLLAGSVEAAPQAFEEAIRATALASSPNRLRRSASGAGFNSSSAGAADDRWRSVSGSTPLSPEQQRQTQRWARFLDPSNSGGPTANPTSQETAPASSKLASSRAATLGASRQSSAPVATPMRSVSSASGGSSQGGGPRPDPDRSTSGQQQPRVLEASEMAFDDLLSFLPSLQQDRQRI